MMPVSFYDLQLVIAFCHYSRIRLFSSDSISEFIQDGHQTAWSWEKGDKSLLTQNTLSCRAQSVPDR
jgi:hypothetical protein